MKNFLWDTVNSGTKVAGETVTELQNTVKRSGVLVPSDIIVMLKNNLKATAREPVWIKHLVLPLLLWMMNDQMNILLI